MRETLAAIMLKEMIGDHTPAEIQSVTLCDPMMGSGTLLTEARSLWQGQFQRPFAFQQWKNAPKLFLSPHFIFNYDLPASLVFKKFVGFDIEEKMLKVTSANFAEVERQIEIQEKADFKKATLRVYCENSLESTARPSELLHDENLWMILNPPYGKGCLNSTRGD